MLNIFYLDFNPSSNAHGISSYTQQYLSGMGLENEITLTCIWVNSIGLSLKREIIKGVQIYHLPRFDPLLQTKLSESEWIANCLVEIISAPDPIIHINWVGHCEIAKL